MDKELKAILARRDEFNIGTVDWSRENLMKSRYLESKKQSMKESILAFYENQIPFGKGFVRAISPNALNDLTKINLRRGWVEYNPTYRHPIPYVLVKYGEKYFFTLRESGGTETRLHGKKGLIGGHVDTVDSGSTIVEIIETALMREIKEEAGITEDMIVKRNFEGYINKDEGVDADHLGLVYTIEVNTDDIQSEEEGILKGIWVDEEYLISHYKELESWSQEVCKNIIFKTVTYSKDGVTRTLLPIRIWNGRSEETGEHKTCLEAYDLDNNGEVVDVFLKDVIMGKNS